VPAFSGLFAERGEGLLVVGIDGDVLTATATAVLSTRAITTSTSTTSGATAGSATGSATTGTATSTTSTASSLRLDVALVNLDNLLDLSLTLTLGLAGAGGGDEVVILVLDEGLGVGPLLIKLATLVGLSDLGGTLESQLLLGELGEVLLVRDVLVLRLGLDGLLGLTLAFSLSLGLSDLLASDLVLQLGLALSGAPGLSSLLFGTTIDEGG